MSEARRELAAHGHATVVLRLAGSQPHGGIDTALPEYGGHPDTDEAVRRPGAAIGSSVCGMSRSPRWTTLPVPPPTGRPSTVV